ncbi:MAG TPA: hypothetical protein VN317_10740, partial [Candidatus Methanoperedens sp.]|nr:hypothetical protein [Candidatus Methanoperedens sp.]
MSYILEALKKSERKRPPGPVPDLFTVQGPLPAARSGRRLPVVAGGASIIVLAALVGWVWLASQDRQPRALPVAPVAVPQSAPSVKPPQQAAASPRPSTAAPVVPHAVAPIARPAVTPPASPRTSQGSGRPVPVKVSAAPSVADAPEPLPTPAAAQA